MSDNENSTVVLDDLEENEAKLRPEGEEKAPKKKTKEFNEKNKEYKQHRQKTRTDIANLLLKEEEERNKFLLEAGDNLRDVDITNPVPKEEIPGLKPMGGGPIENDFNNDGAISYDDKTLGELGEKLKLANEKPEEPGEPPKLKRMDNAA